MQVNEVIELEIESMSFGPAAVARHGESRAVVFVTGAIPGEKVRARLTKKYKNYWEAELVEVLSSSPDRIAPPCAVFEKCGGCQWQFMTYEAQVRAKKEILVHQLKRTARLPLEEIESKLTVHPAKNPFGYRARLQVHGDARGLGFYGSRTHDIVHTDKCLVAHPDVQKAWDEFRASRPLAELAKATGQFKVEWTRTETGQLREAINRKHGALGFTQVNLEQNEVLKDLVKTLASKAPKHDVLFDLYGGDGNLSRNLSGTFARTACVDLFNQGADPADLNGELKPGLSLINAKVEDFLVNQYWRDWGVERPDCVIADPPRDGMRDAASKVAALNASRVVLVSCDPSTLARDLTAFSTSYSIDAIHLVDMFPQTYHLETVVALSRTQSQFR